MIAKPKKKVSLTCQLQGLMWHLGVLDRSIILNAAGSEGLRCREASPEMNLLWHPYRKGMTEPVTAITGITIRYRVIYRIFSNSITIMAETKH
jgi:hypothetical protein